MKLLRYLAFSGLTVAAMGTLIYATPDDFDPTDTSTTTVSATKMGQMSPTEMTVQADTIMTDVRSMLRHVTQLAEKARRDKDIIKLNCVNDKLVPMKGEVNLAETTRHVLEEAISSTDEGARYASYTDLTIRHDKIKDLRDQADACVGDALTYIGKTDVTVTGPSGPLYPPESGGQEVEPPTYRSPFD